MDRRFPFSPRCQHLANKAREAAWPHSLEVARPGGGQGRLCLLRAGELQDLGRWPRSWRPHQHVVWAESPPRWPVTWTWPSTPWTSRNVCCIWRAVSALPGAGMGWGPLRAGRAGVSGDSAVGREGTHTVRDLCSWPGLGTGRHLGQALWSQRPGLKRRKRGSWKADQPGPLPRGQ